MELPIESKCDIKTLKAKRGERCPGNRFGRWNLDLKNENKNT